MTQPRIKTFCDLIATLNLSTPQVRDALKDLDGLYAVTVGGQRDNVALLTGPTRSGKSTLVRMLQAKYPAYNDPITGDLQQPVVIVVVPENCTTKALAYAVLEKLKVPFVKAPERELVTMMKFHMRKQGVQILVLDELQHMIDSRANKQRFAQGTTDWIKVLTTEGVCSVLGVGVESTQILVTMNPQFGSRLHPNIELVPLDMADKADRSLFLAMLARIQDAFKDVLEFKLTSGDLPHRLMIASRGCIGSLIKVIRDAGTIAIMAEEEAVTIEHIDRGWRKSQLRKSALLKLFDGTLPLEHFMSKTRV